MKKRNWRDETKREDDKGSGKETEKVVYSGTRLV